MGNNNGMGGQMMMGSNKRIGQTTQRGDSNARPASLQQVEIGSNPQQPQRPANPQETATSIQECLELSTDTVITPQSNATTYEAARACLVLQPGYDPRPADQIIVQPKTVSEVASVVKCAAKFNVSISARSGAFSFRTESCRGHMVVDLAKLEGGVTVDKDTNFATWSSGLVHGQLYGQLLEHSLVVSGGGEVMVGTGGLWLGCGRGRLTPIHGASCETLRAIEYVDAQGEIQIANSTSNPDMFWMARGGGGFFPGVVTKFTAQAFPFPELDLVVKEVCSLPNNQVNMKAMLQAFLPRLDELNDSNNPWSTSIQAQRPTVSLEFNCYGCSVDTLATMDRLKFSLIETMKEYAPDAYPDCKRQFHTHESFLLHQATWDDYVVPADLQKRSEWPEWFTYQGGSGVGEAFNGGMLVPVGWNFTESFIDEVVNYTQTFPGEYDDRTWKDFFAIYPIQAKGQRPVEDFAYTGLDASAVIHYKQEHITPGTDLQPFRDHMSNFERALSERHGLPCKVFYNYADEDVGCAMSQDELSAALFSDHKRVREIVEKFDPDTVFYNMWQFDPETVVYNVISDTVDDNNATSIGYCSWSNCNGTPEGGEWCNEEETQCAVCGNGSQWCT